MSPRSILPVLVLTLAAPGARADGTGAPAPEAVVVVERPPVWYAGGGLIATSLLDSGADLIRAGGGFSAWVGLNVTRALSLELGWLGCLQAAVPGDTVTGLAIFYGVTGDAKLHLGRGALRPYLQAGLGTYHVDGLGFDLFGPGYQIGGGLDVWVGRHLSLGGRALLRGMWLGQDGGGASGSLHVATLEASISVHF